MISKNDLYEAIAECKGVKNPTAKTCSMLASFYTILDHMEESEDYSFSASDEIVSYNGSTEFLQAVAGKDMQKILEIVDELMSTLQVINPRLYKGVMRKITE